jgi:hypothetical protein
MVKVVLYQSSSFEEYGNGTLLQVASGKCRAEAKGSRKQEFLRDSTAHSATCYSRSHFRSERADLTALLSDIHPTKKPLSYKNPNSICCCEENIQNSNAVVVRE